MAAIEARLPLLALLLTCLVSWTALAETDERQSAPLHDAQLTFRTMDDNTQQVNAYEIWRIRGAATSDGPPGAVVINYASKRVYVKESLASVVEKVGGVRPLMKFTLPGGGPVYIAKVTGLTRAIETDKRHPAAIAPQGTQLTFQTLDDDTQQINPEEIWRIRATSTSDEPPGAVVINYASKRVYVKESLANVVEKVSGMRPLKKYTLPGGAPVYIVTSKVIGIIRAIAHQSHPNAHAIIVVREGQTQVQESPEAVNVLMHELSHTQ